MNRLTKKLVSGWTDLGPRFLPFADIATPDLPLSRLLRLSLFQVSVGMALVMLVGTLNRVMIVELDVPASLVGIILAIPLVFAPFRALIGFRSDTHHCALGWRRVPFIWKGTLLQFGGFSIMPFALLVLAGKGASADLPAWFGQAAAAVAFLLAGAGAHIVQTAGLALATDLTPVKSHAKVVGLMYIMLLMGMILSAVVFGLLLDDFSPGRLVQVVQGAAIATLVLNVVAMWKQESRRSRHTGFVEPAIDSDFHQVFARFLSANNARQQLLVVGVGTLAFGMADILLEPFGGQVLLLSVGATTRLTAILAIGGLCGFAYAVYVLNRGINPHRVARDGALVGIPAFVLIILTEPLGVMELFLAGNFLIGFGGALFGHGTLTATMNHAPPQQAGLAIGAWGAVQASAAGLGIAISGIVRDLVNAIVPKTEGFWGFTDTAIGYIAVYLLEIVFLVATVIAIVPLLRRVDFGAVDKQAFETNDASAARSRTGKPQLEHRVL